MRLVGRDGKLRAAADIREGAHPMIEPLLYAQSFYRMANALSLARGHNPDAPPHLRKVTETL